MFRKRKRSGQNSATRNRTQVGQIFRRVSQTLKIKNKQKKNMGKFMHEQMDK